MYSYEKREDVPYDIKRDIRDEVSNALLNGVGWLEPVTEYCNREGVVIDCPAINSLILDQIELMEYELNPWYEA